MDAYLEIIRADGTSERSRITAEQVTLGRAPSSGIAIPDARELEAEHLLISPREDGCWVSANKKAAVSALVRGTPFAHGLLPWGSEIEVGTVRVRISVSGSSEEKPKPVSVTVVLLAIALIAVGSWLFLSPSAADFDLKPETPPPLFATSVTCSDAGPLALHRAEEAGQSALAKSERYPFDPQDGIQSVELYRLSAACYRAVGLWPEAAHMSREAEGLRKGIEEDYRTRRLRLERALNQERFRDALMETRAIMALVHHKEGSYTSWLASLERQLGLQVGKEVVP